MCMPQLRVRGGGGSDAGTLHVSEPLVRAEVVAPVLALAAASGNAAPNNECHVGLWFPA